MLLVVLLVLVVEVLSCEWLIVDALLDGEEGISASPDIECRSLVDSLRRRDQVGSERVRRRRE